MCSPPVGVLPWKEHLEELRERVVLRPTDQPAVLVGRTVTDDEPWHQRVEHFGGPPGRDPA